MYGSRTHYHHVLCDSRTPSNMGVKMSNWIMNILLAILITLALLCLLQMGINFVRLGWY